MQELYAAHPGASGLVTASWDVEGGVVSNVRVWENTTGDDGFGACVSRTIGTWRFGTMDCEVAGYTWRVEGSQ